MPLIDLKSDLTWKGKTPPGDAGPQDRLSRSVRDTIRISKYLTSPDGALFTLKQVGLQLTNPNTENILGLPNVNPITNPNKQFTPVNLLANVAGAGLGIRVSRHGLLPFAELSNYESTVVRNRPDPIENNRLIRLKRELIDSEQVIPAGRINQIVTNITQQIQTKLGYSGKVINTLSGVTGPKSLLGIGTTTFRLAEKRYPARGTQNYTITSQYALLDAGFGKSIDADNNNNSRLSIDSWTSSPNTRTDTQFSKLGDDYLDITVNKQIPDSLSNPVQINENNRYVTVAYGRIPKDKVGDVTQIRNFINLIDKKDRETLLSEEGIGTYKTQADYNQKNIIKKFGYKHYTTKTKANKSVTDLDSSTIAGGYSKDIVKFQIGSTKIRAYIDSISDSFTPSIDTEQPLGSPINAVRYTTLDRSVSVSFKMAVFVKSDLKQIYKKMQELQSYASYNTQAGNAFTLQTINVIIGDLYNFEGYVESVTFDWDSEMPWEIEDGNQAPLYCNASIDFKYLVPMSGFKLVK